MAEGLVQLNKRLEMAQLQGSGAGLVLAMVQQLCTVLQGRITLRSKQEKGTLFRIIFPRDTQIEGGIPTSPSHPQDQQTENR
jgi:K+-sensing histidine kinase KdpD